MKRLLFLPFVALLAVGGCAGLQRDADAGSTAASTSLKATQLAMTTYADVYQPAVLYYGSLPACPAATLCRDTAIHAKLKAADLAVTKAVSLAADVTSGKVVDTGQLLGVIEAIQSAEVTIGSSGALSVNR